MLQLILLLIGLAFVDSLNPYSIGLQIYLILFTKRKITSLLFIFGVFITYFSCGIGVFLGIDLFIMSFFDTLFQSIGSAVDYIEFILGLLLMLYEVMKIIRNRRPTKVVAEDDNKKTSTKVFAIILLGSLGVLSDMPTAVPYLAFIARLSEVNLSLLSSILMLLLYNVIFILPEVVLLVIWLVNKEQIEKKLQKGKQIIQKLNQIITPILMFGIGMFLIIDSIFYLF